MRVRAGLLGYEPSEVKPGWIALFLVLLLIGATFLLWRSMNTQLGKIRVPPRASFENGRPDESEPTAPSSSPGDGADRADEPPPPS